MDRPELADVKSVALSELTHYGVRGMRWGKHKSQAGGSTRTKKASAPEHADSARATELLSRAKGKTGSKAKSLSNQELEVLLTRLNLEKRLKDLAPVRDTSSQVFIKRLTGNTQKGLENTAQQTLNMKLSELAKKATT